MGIDINNINCGGGLIDASNTTNNHFSNNQEKFIENESEQMQEDLSHNHQNNENAIGCRSNSFSSKQYSFNQDNKAIDNQTESLLTDHNNSDDPALNNVLESTKTPIMADLLHKLTESSSILSSSSSSGIGSTDHHDYDLSRSPSSDTFIQSRQKREGSVASQGSSSIIDTKEGIGYLLSSGCGGKKSRKEVIPQRKRRDFIPNELKDDSYWERRRKNNLAAKRSREKRRLNDIVLETKVLELTNINNAMKLKFDLCIKKYAINEDDVDKMFEENKHLLVIQETLDMSELLTNEDSLNNDSEHFATLSSSSSNSGKRGNDVSSNNITHSSLHHQNSCSISTSSCHHIDSSGRSNSSSVDDAECDVGIYNDDAVSENDLEIDENLDTINETNGKDHSDVTEKRKPSQESHFISELSSSPPSKRKSFFNPTHTSSCPSKSPSPTLIQSTGSLSPIDSYQTSLKQQQTKSDKLMSKSIKTEPVQMKSQYPLLYNQLCKQSKSPVSSQSDNVPSLEQQNQILLNSILNQKNNNNITDNPLMKTLLTELLNRTNSSATEPDTPTHNSNEILTKILSSSIPSNGSLVERLSALLKPAQQQAKSVKQPLAGNMQANALMEKYKNLINKTNNSGQQNNNNPQQFNQKQQTNVDVLLQHQQLQQYSLKSTAAKVNQPPSQATAPTSKNTVNNLLQSYSAHPQAAEPNGPAVTQQPKSKNNSSSRKRHLASETTSHDFNSLLSSNPELLAYASKHSEQNQNFNRNTGKNGTDLNEMVAMMLAAQQQNTYNRQATIVNQQPQQQQQRNQQFNNQNSAKNSSNLAKNQTYNQLLMMHQTQKLQQRQQQHEAALLNQRNNLQQAYMNSEDLTGHSATDNQGPGGQQMSASQIQQFYQQQQLVANGQNNNNNNNSSSQNSGSSNGDNNMPLKLRFKMLQLKTGEVN